MRRCLGLEKKLHGGVKPTELRYLIGRIGELYAAVITNGKMVENVSQHGYDITVASPFEGGENKIQRVSVKTTARSGRSGHIAFNRNTLSQVDRIMILHVDIDNMQVNILFDNTKEKALSLMHCPDSGKCKISMSKLKRSHESSFQVGSVEKEIECLGFIIKLYDSGSIRVFKSSKQLMPTKQYLREIASQIDIDIENEKISHFTTRQLGVRIIQKLQNSKP